MKESKGIEADQSANRYYTILNSMDDAFAFCKLIRNDRGAAIDFHYLEFNAAFERQRRKEAESFLGRTAKEVYPGLDPWWIQSFEIAVDSGEVIRAERSFDSRWYEVGIFPFKDDYFCVIFRDITEKKETEDRLRSAARQDSFRVRLMDALRKLTQPEEIQDVIMRMTGEYLDVSRTFCCCIEPDQSVESFVIDHNYCAPGISSIAGRYSTLAFGAMAYDAAVNGRTLAVSDIRIHAGHTSDEREILASLGVRAYIVAPVINDGRLTGFLGIHHCLPREWKREEIAIVQEIAERSWFALEVARKQESLRESQERLTRALRLREEFIGVASHELKTPLTSITAYGQILERQFGEAGDERNENLLHKLNHQSKRLRRMIDDLLDTSTLAENKLLLHKTSFDLNQLLMERTEELQRTSDRHDLVLLLQPLPLVTADRERIAQVFTNLVSNAIKYSPGSRNIVITSEQTPEGTKVCVEDQGIGIPAGAVDKIFERFYRVPDSGKEPVAGMGLGLYISAQIIQLHGGWMNVQSARGKGSAFSFTIP